MAQQTSISPAQPIIIDGEIYRVRTVTVWNDKGTSGTIDDKVKPIIKTQYQEEGVLSQWKDLADRTDNKSVNNGWSFRPSAGQGFKEALVKSGSNSLTSQLDNAAVNQVAKDAKVPTTRAKQVLSTTALTQQNKALAATNQDPTAASGGSNVAQQAAAGLSTATNLDTGGAVGRNGVGTYGNLFYPLDLGNTFQDKIRFTIIEYKPRGLEIGTLSSGGSGSVKNAGSFGLRPKGNILGSVTLPIPGGISDTNNVGWQDNTMNAFQLAAANVAMKSIQEGFGSGAEALGSAAEAASQGPANQELKDAIAPFFAALAMQGDASALISRTQGAVLNPNLELLFNGPELRSFSFTFKMSARSKQEGDEIVKIIRAFKQSMSAQKSTAQLFVKAPNIYKIEYLHKTKGDNVHKRIGKIKECALMSFTTNYTPEGQYATYYDGTMVSYEIQMQFKELEPVFNNDYTGPDTEIGF